MSAATVLGPGHPDQACDLVVAAVVEEYLRRDPDSRLNIRACGGKGTLFLAGEIASAADFDVSATIKQTLATCGVLGAIEPFIAFEPMGATWAKAIGSHEPVTVQGFATSETAELSPKSVVLARQLARLLEMRRTTDQDWYWLGADYEVSVFLTIADKPLVLIRAEHLDTQSLERVRELIQRACELIAPGAELRINPAGEDTQAGLMARIGSSGRNLFDVVTSVPLSASGVGLHLRHPRVAGAIACRAIARRLVRAGKGSAIAVRATWLPLETRAAFVRIWNEQGEDLSGQLTEDELDLSRLPEDWLAPEIATALVRAATDPSVSLPWER